MQERVRVFQRASCGSRPTKCARFPLLTCTYESHVRPRPQAARHGASLSLQVFRADNKSTLTLTGGASGCGTDCLCNVTSMVCAKRCLDFPQCLSYTHRISDGRCYLSNSSTGGRSIAPSASPSTASPTVSPTASPTASPTVSCRRPQTSSNSAFRAPPPLLAPELCRTADLPSSGQSVRGR